MNNNTLSALLTAFVGAVIGVLCVLLFQKVENGNRTIKTRYEDWQKLNLILETVDKNYVDSVDRKKVTDVAAAAALSALDPHSVYLPPVERVASEETLAGAFEGIGIQFNVPNDTAVVIEVIPGGPSQKAGLMPGDRLLKVDSVGIAGCKYPQDSMVRRMRGTAGSKVHLLIRRGNEDIPFDIVRDKIPTYSVEAAFMVDESKAYMRLSKFSRTTFNEFSSAISSLEAQGMKELILDLRDNTGGYLDQALLLSDAFLEKGDTIVYIQGLHRKREDFLASGSGKCTGLPLKILINEGTASSSEIFSGAMQDNHRAVIYGRRSFGKGLVQEPVNFTDGSGIRLTVARFYTPSGRCIQKPYTDDYEYEVYKRYSEGEMVVRDSMESRIGGIFPDVFVPVDTTRASDFFLKCNRKATSVRFSSYYFDRHKAELLPIDDYSMLLAWLDKSSIEKDFLHFASSVDGIVPKRGEWESTRDYMMPQIRALVGRYSKLGDEAFYHLYLQVDDVYKAALTGR